MKDEKTGDDLVSIGFVVDLDYADATTSAHDLLQLFKLHPLVKKILEGGERVAWGAKALPGGGYWSMPKLTMPGALLVGDSGGHGRHGRAEGRPPLHQVGHPGRRGDLRRAEGRRTTSSRPTRRPSRSPRSARSSTRCATRASRSRRASSRAARSSTLAIATKGKFPPGSWRGTATTQQADVHRQDQGQLSQARRQVHVRQALVGLHHGQRDARRRAQPHPRAEERAARDRRDVEVDVPGGRLRDPRRRARDTATST